MEKCKYSFLELINCVFPQYLEELSLGVSNPFLVSNYFNHQKGLAQIKNEFGFKNDFKGLYAFIKGKKVIYVGISRNVIKRLNNHCRGRLHNQATLAYKLAKILNKYEGLRKDLDLELGLKQISKLKFCFIQIDCPIERYAFELYCSMHYKCKHNSFETH